MVSVITSLSRITILAYVLIFTLIDMILIFQPKINETVEQILTTIQIVMIVLFLTNSSVVLYMSTGNSLILILLLFQFVLFIGMSVLKNILTDFAPGALINNCMFFLSFSFLFLERLKLTMAVRQLIFAFISLAVAAVVVVILKRISDIHRFLFLFAAIGILSLVLVCLMGNVEYGAKLSLSIGDISIQPSEFAKLSFLFFIGGCIVSFKDFRGFLFSSIGTVAHLLILVISKDLGTALIFLLTYLFMIFIAYKNYIVLTLELVVTAIGGVAVYNLFPHIRRRFIAWSDPLSVIENQGYQISQSLFAIGTSGWLGAGINNGMPTKIPVVTKDFIFAAISEEMGGVVAVCLIICMCCTMIYIFNQSFACSDSFYMLITGGFALIFAIQTILNIGGVIKFIPSTGVTLPFVSYGGSSLLSMFVGIYIVLCCHEFSQDNTHKRRYYE